MRHNGHLMALAMVAILPCQALAAGSIEKAEKAFNKKSLPGGRSLTFKNTFVMLDGKKVRAQLRVERAANGETEFKLSIPQKGAEGILSAMGRTDGGYRSEVCRINGKLCVVSGSSVCPVSREVARKARPSYAEAQARYFQGVDGFATYSWKDHLGDHHGRTEEAGWEGKAPRWSKIFDRLFRRLTSQPSFTLTDVGIRRIK